MKNKYYITNSVAVDRFCSVKLADLCYSESGRPDDRGSLFVAPALETGWDSPVGLLIVYATTNGDPIMLGQIEDSEITWFDGNQDSEGFESLREVLRRAAWCHPSSGEGYSYLVEDSI